MCATGQNRKSDTSPTRRNRAYYRTTQPKILGLLCLLVSYWTLAFLGLSGAGAFHEFLNARLSGKQTGAVHLGARPRRRSCRAPSRLTAFVLGSALRQRRVYGGAGGRH